MYNIHKALVGFGQNALLLVCKALIALFFSLHLHAQPAGLKIAQIDTLLASYRPNQALLSISEYLQSEEGKIDEASLKELQLQKHLALCKANKFAEMLEFSAQLFGKYPNDKLVEIRLRIDRALAFEIMEAYELCLAELQGLDTLVQPYRESKYYGIYLYRYSSYYRLTKNTEKARAFATEAYHHGNKHGYAENTQVASMLLGLLADKGDYANKLRYFHDALAQMRTLQDSHGACYMCIGIAKVWREQKVYGTALLYLDSALWYIKGREFYEEASYCYLQKSELFKEIHQVDSAYANLLRHLDENKSLDMLKTKEVALGLEYDYERNKRIKDLQEQMAEGARLENSNRWLWFFLTILIMAFGVIAYQAYLLHKSERRVSKQNVEVNHMNVALKESDQVKDALLKEVSHRVKNNFSLIISLLDQYMIASNDDGLQPVLDSLQRRVYAIALAHDMLAYNQDTTNTAPIDVYLAKVSEALLALESREVKLIQNIPNIQLNADTSVPIGMLINELITNTLKYAKPSNETLSIFISLIQSQDTLLLYYRDNGNNFVEKPSYVGVGTIIIESMTKQLRGAYRRKGAEYSFELKIKN